MRKPIPILFTIPNFITAGSGRAMLNIIERLDLEVFSPAVCVMRKGGRLDKEVERLGIPFIEAPFVLAPRPYSDLLVRVWKAAEAFRPFKFCLWHSFHYGSDFTEPLIARMAGAKAWVYTKKNMSWGNKAWYLRSLLANRIAIQNTTMLEKFFHAMRGKVHYIPPGVDTQLFRPGPANLEIRSGWGFPPDSCIVVHVGHFVRVKNQQFLLHVLAQTSQNLCLVFAGDFLDKDYVSEIITLVTQLGLRDRVRLLGKVDDIPNLLRSADIFAFCSQQEGCPVAVLEAMASGLPCVVTDIPAMKDIHVNGETGFVVPSEDIQTFAQMLEKLAQDESLRVRLGNAAREWIQRLFTIEREVQAYQKLYLDLVSGAFV